MAQLLLMYTYKCTSHLKAGTTREKQTLQVTNLSQSIVSFFFFFTVNTVLLWCQHWVTLICIWPTGCQFVGFAGLEMGWVRGLSSLRLCLDSCFLALPLPVWLSTLRWAALWNHVVWSKDENEPWLWTAILEMEPKTNLCSFELFLFSVCHNRV